jgi:menaquinone-dependent protoporphyrinogen oxidase
MKVLVTAASRHRATDEIAEAIATGLIARGLEAGAVPVGHVTSVDGYDAAVLGSAVYMGRWLGEARRFAQIYASELTAMPVWLFSSGPVGPPDHLVPAGESADVPVLLRLTRALGHRTFTGRLDMKHLPFAERMTARAIHAPDGDHRDWDAIDDYAEQIATALLATRVGA